MIETQNTNTVERMSYRLSELAQASGLSVDFLRAEIRQGKLSARRRGTAVFVLKSDAENYLLSAEEWKPGQFKAKRQRPANTAAA